MTTQILKSLDECQTKIPRLFYGDQLRITSPTPLRCHKMQVPALAESQTLSRAR